MVSSSDIDIKKLQRFYKLRNLVRYNQMSRTTNESVAEHTYYVVLFTDLICKYLKVSDSIRLSSLDYAISHDLSEIYTSDVPHPVKASNPELDAMLHNIEIKVMREHMPEFATEFEAGIYRHDEKVSTIVDLADIVSVIQYANSQIKLGNSYFNDVLDNALSRYNECKNKICELFKLDNFNLFEKEN